MQSCAHEAGHAIVADGLGAGVDKVLVRSDGSGLTCTVSQTDQRGHVQLLLAGGVAEEQYCSAVGTEALAEHHPRHYKIDEWVGALDVCKEMCGGDVGRAVELREELLALVVDEIERRSTEVAAVAIALSQSGSLSGSAFYELIRAAATSV